ncbi:hypothetical protein ONE63_002131 [Megalurothrips usitatus]|uniref:G-protein coupled receptors family 1 profile domain-containing protein n=1 Tax=Megalurothrips usitatus TaxID=439358 RepID=A0AAV7XEQ3_9NEOP|nr:hypothetical protein ONE63_002131 [Megalurothrips usitatus]
MDVTCSTSSIFNLVAISIDRYIAVTQPIKYAKHKNNRRVWCTIVVVWLISCAIGTPIVLGLNNTPDRSPDLCIFYNTDFVIYSSLSSFYIPCMIMIVLYFNIYKVSQSSTSVGLSPRHFCIRVSCVFLWRSACVCVIVVFCVFFFSFLILVTNTLIGPRNPVTAFSAGCGPHTECGGRWGGGGDCGKTQQFLTYILPSGGGVRNGANV